MKNFVFIENNKINGFGNCKCTNKNITNIEISNEIYDLISKEPLLYVYNNGQIIKNPNYENEKQKEIIEKRLVKIQKELDILDKKRIRAICEDEIKDEKTGETWLDYYNSQIYDLRIEYKNLKAQL